ncbi:hypothetical protein LTR94_027085, partial [Friedmanniomyces endolithicus]
MVPLSLRRGGARGAKPTQIVTEETSRTLLDLMRRNVVKGSGGFADAPGLRVGGKTGSANKLVNGRYDPSHAVGSFAAVFPVDGPLDAKRYAILIVMDEPGAYPKTGAYVAAPAVRNIADRIAGFLGVERREDRWRTATGEKVPEYQDVAPGALFVALPGTAADGRAFIPQALAQGAAAVLAPVDTPAEAAPVLVTSGDVRRAYAIAARGFYGAQPKTCVAVTGTNGKTSVATFCRQIWAGLGRKSASMGTLGVVGQKGDKTYALTGPGLTSPDAAEAARLMAELASKEVTHVALEASSHGIDQRRLDGVALKAAAFTNLTQDHLDYHGTMEGYRNAKLRLFETLLPRGRTAVLNADSDAYSTFASASIMAGLGIFG